MLSKFGTSFVGSVLKFCVRAYINSPRAAFANAASLSPKSNGELISNVQSNDGYVYKKSDSRRLNQQRLLLLNKLTHQSSSKLQARDSIVDFVSAVDSKALVSSSDLDILLKLLKDDSFDPSILADRQKSSLIKATGRKCRHLTAIDRTYFMNEIVSIFQRKDNNWGVEMLNAFVSVRIDNNVKLDTVGILKEYQNRSVEPDAHTYELLSRICAKNADLATLLQLINHMQNNKISASRTTINSLIFALAFADHDHQANSIIETFDNNDFFNKWLKLTYAAAKMKKGDVDSAFKTLRSIELSKADWEQMMLVLFAYFENDPEPDIEKLLPMFSQILTEDGKLDTGTAILCALDYIFDALASKENLLPALRIAKLLPDFYTRNLSEELEAFLKSLDMNNGELLTQVIEEFSRAKVLIDEAVDPLRFLMDHAVLSKNKDVFKRLYDLYTETDEYQKFSGRLTQILPKIFDELENVKTSDKQGKIRLFTRIADEIFKLDAVDFNAVDSCFLKPLLQVGGVLVDVLHKIDHSHFSSNFIIKQVFYHLALNEEFDELKRLFEGSHGNLILENTGTDEALSQLLLLKNTSSALKDFTVNIISSKLAKKSTRDSTLKMVREAVESEEFDKKSWGRLLRELEIHTGNEENNSVETQKQIASWKKKIANWMNEEDLEVLEKEMESTSSDEESLVLNTVLFGKTMTRKASTAHEVESLYNSVCTLFENLDVLLPKEMCKAFIDSKVDYPRYRNWRVMIKLAYASWLFNTSKAIQAKEILSELDNCLDSLAVEMFNNFTYLPLSIADEKFIRFLFGEFEKKAALKVELFKCLALVQNNLIKRNDFVKAAVFLVHSKSRTFNQTLTLLDAAYRNGRIEEFKKVFNVLVSAGNAKQTNFVLAYLLLKNGKIDLAFNIYEANGFPSEILTAHVERLLRKRDDRVTVLLLKKLLTSEEKPESLIKHLTLEIIDHYKKIGEKDGLKLFQREIETSSMDFGSSISSYLRSSLAA